MFNIPLSLIQEGTNLSVEQCIKIAIRLQAHFASLEAKAKAIREYDNKFIIQIGSHIGNTENDPIFKIVNSTTKMILVEPVPHLFKQLQDNYKIKFQNLANITFINKAVSNFVGEIEMTVPSYDNDYSQFPTWASQLASINPLHVHAHLPNLKVNKIQVETTTLDDIIKEYNVEEIYLLQTDTEGHDYTILMNYSFIIKPQKIVFEHKHMDGFCTVGQKYIELSKKLLSMGYTKKYKNTEDTMFEL